MIKFTVEDIEGDRSEISIAENDRTNLMEVLTGFGFNILAACGGMALCGTCHVQFIEGAEKLTAPLTSELQMLDMLPDAGKLSRLSCQVHITQDLDGAVIKIMPLQ